MDGYFPDLASALASHVTVLESDPPGIGKTSHGSPLRLSDYTASLANRIRHGGPDPVALVGHSLGGLWRSGWRSTRRTWWPPSCCSTRPPDPAACGGLLGGWGRRGAQRRAGPHDEQRHGDDRRSGGPAHAAVRVAGLRRDRLALPARRHDLLPWLFPVGLLGAVALISLSNVFGCLLAAVWGWLVFRSVALYIRSRSHAHQGTSNRNAFRDADAHYWRTRLM